MTNFRIRVAIVDFEEKTRNAYALLSDVLPGFKFISAYANTQKMLGRIDIDDPDLVVLTLPYLNGDLINDMIKVKKLNQGIEILLVSKESDPAWIMKALQAGAGGFLFGEVNFVKLTEAIEEISGGGAPMSPEIAKIVIKSFNRNYQTPLTKRETEVLDHLAQGKTYEYIAKELFVGKETIKTHVRNIYDKLQVDNKNDAIKIGLENKYI
ncbi:MAG: response regulator transcription factor [Cyclobacteriaceae bacterium]